MILSMTGFGQAEGKFNGNIYSIEIRSVNNKFLDFNLRYPKSFEKLDLDIKELVRKKITRGKILLNIICANDSLNSGSSLPKLDSEKVEYYYKTIEQLRKIIGSKQRITLENILSFQDVFTIDEKDEIAQEEIEFVFSLVNDALDDLSKMKLSEGEYLKNDILNRIRTIDEEIKIIVDLYGSNRENISSKLKEKVRSIIDDLEKIDQNRVEFEIVMLAEKLDITEECIRLESHLKYFSDFVESKELSGRRLNFLIQEMNREINTIASKSSNAEISQRVSFLKEELEKIREQLQNIE